MAGSYMLMEKIGDHPYKEEERELKHYINELDRFHLSEVDSVKSDLEKLKLEIHYQKAQLTSLENLRIQHEQDLSKILKKMHIEEAETLVFDLGTIYFNKVILPVANTVLNKQYNWDTFMEDYFMKEDNEKELNDWLEPIQSKVDLSIRELIEATSVSLRNGWISPESFKKKVLEFDPPKDFEYLDLFLKLKSFFLSLDQ
eukprot:TRINITY_DN102_c0_g1_i2.p1 TRINITY_DN102_c0_g1~~TRINITY_DN102_c0_g1_i2.p1  ORF type:complete len:200 (+),score=42.58 TRINITY_DN102_c0_g1_i2:113-712(+)